ncbi:thioredoxin O1, mitochondrial-like [Bidens hawaiensis]|uniref:thioredoxin O1, mitochondrial-like n=1 Tax=Bidens hawaiensis TaxID=980011 RepID=UPI00404B4CC2
MWNPKNKQPRVWEKMSCRKCGKMHAGECKWGTGSDVCRKCGKSHGGEYRSGSNACYKCGKMGHFAQDCHAKPACYKCEQTGESWLHGVYCGSLFSSVCEIVSASSSNPATIPYSYSVSSVITKPISKFQSEQHPSTRNHCSSSGESRVVTVDSEDQFNTLLRKVQDESLPAIFYFTAAWCGPCRLLSPHIVELSEKYTNVTTYKIDIDQEGLRRTLEKLEISSVPTLHFFAGGKKASEMVGADIQKLKNTMESLYK